MEDIIIRKNLKSIGKINLAISKSETLDEAVKNGLEEIIDSLDIEYAVIWYQDNNNDKNLHPYYWIAPLDMTNKYNIPGEGIVGKVFSTQKAARILDYQNHKDEKTENDFDGIEIASMVCAPLSNNDDSIGCIQFINTTSTHKISEEEADACDILCMMASIAFNEKSENQDLSWQQRSPIMNVKNIYKEFHNGDGITKALNGVNFDIYEGEFLVILGESGCGKSTLLNILAGLERVTSGTLMYLNEEISKYSQDGLTQYRRNNIGFVFQKYNLMPNLTAKQNLDLIGELVENHMDSVEALDMVGLKNKVNNYPSELSGGQQQRISIARALVKRPKIIFADEPTAALDYSTSIEVLEVFENIMKTGTTLIMVTHNEEISHMADRIIRIRNGQIYEVTINKQRAAAKDLVW